VPQCDDRRWNAESQRFAPLVIWLGIGPVGWKLIGIWQMAPKGQQIA
jgi:hypothetical protein